MTRLRFATSALGVLLALAAGAGAQAAPPADPAVAPAAAPATAPAPATAAAPSHQDAAADLTAAQVTAERDRIAALPDLDPVVRDAAVARYNEALDKLAAADAAATRRVEYERQIAETPALLAGIRAELAVPPATPVPAPPADASLNQMVQLAEQAEAELLGVRKQLSDLLLESERRNTRRREIPTELAGLRQQLTLVDESLAAAGGAGDDEAAKALRALRLAERKALAQSVAALEKELASYDARTDLLPARRDRAQRRVTDGEALVAAWQKLVQDRRARDTSERAARAETLATNVAERYPALEAIADENARLAAQLKDTENEDGVTTLINQVSSRLAETRRQLAELRADHAKVLDKVRQVGLNDAMGLLLRKQFARLPDLSAVTRNAQRWARLQTEVQVELLAIEDRRAEIGDVEREVQALMAGIAARDTVPEGTELEDVARFLLNTRRDTLDELRDAYETLQEYLFELSPLQQQLIAETRTARDYIEERILWVRSIPLGAWPGPSDVVDPLLWLVSPSEWWRGVTLALETARSDWEGTLLLALALLAYTAALPLCRRRLAEATASVRDRRRDGFRATVVALAGVVLLSAWLPAMLWSASWLLARPSEQVPAVLAGAAGLDAAASLSWLLLLVMLLLRRGGVGDAHFRWPAAALDSLRHGVQALAPVLVPAAAVAAAVPLAHDEDWGSGLGRVALLVRVTVIALFVLRTLGGRRPLMTTTRARHPTSPVVRLHWLWFTVALGLPVGCAVLSVLGFHDTAERLVGRTQTTGWLVLGLVLASALAVRWQFLVRRQVALEQARQKREAAGTVPTEAAGETEAAFTEDEPDLLVINARTRQLVRTLIGVGLIVGSWLIWYDVLPALRRLDRVQIWPTVTMVAEEVMPAAGSAAVPLPAAGGVGSSAAPAGPNPPSAGTPASVLINATRPASGAAAPGTEDAGPSVTLADLALALMILVTTLLAARNLPAVLEMALLSRFATDSGARYAIRSLVSYAIAIFGGFAAFGAIGIGWNQVQWLAAALTFGLAFGLQEIFANFVSGLIILLERPVRIGDIVTVGEVEGRVSRIRIRSTTITDWNRRELLVPNKEFITGQVINWSLTDSISREVLQVGVAYGSDTARAQQILLEVARECPFVLADPAPSAIFRAFGDSTLHFELRVFMETRDVWLKLIHDINQRIHKRFAEAGIEIAFPQRDLHLRSLGPLESRLSPPADPGQAPDA